MKVPMTVNGQAQLRKNLRELESSLSEIAVEIGEAIKHGDLSENADYHANKNKQGMVLAKIAQVKAHLANAQVIDVTKLPQSDRVVFGTTVALLNLNTNERVAYQIVGEAEADLSQGKLSISTPVARSLISCNQGDEVTVEGTENSIRYRIEKVEYI